MTSNPTVPISDGVYKLSNVNSKGYVADLLDGRALGPIVASEDIKGAASQEWVVQNISRRGTIGGTAFILQNVAAPDAYASASIQARGVALSGSPNPTIWIPVLAGDGLWIVIADRSLDWTLSRDGENAPVVLERTNDDGLGSLAKWRLLPVDV